MQIVKEYLDDDLLLSALIAVDETNLTSAVFNATTVDNRVYGIKGGQKVQILLLHLERGKSTKRKFLIGTFERAMESYI